MMSTALRTLGYWRDVEFFHPFDLDSALLRVDRSIVLHAEMEEPLPWHDGQPYELDAEKRYSYDIFLAPFHKREIRDRLAERFPALLQEVVYEDRELAGLSCFARISASSKGELLFDDLRLSTLPWAVSQLVRERELSMNQFEDFVQGVLAKGQRVPGIVAHEDEEEEDLSDPEDDDNPFRGAVDLLASQKTGVDVEGLRRFTELLCENEVFDFFPDGALGYIVPISLGKKKEDEKELLEQKRRDKAKRVKSQQALRQLLQKKRKVDILNSFYIRDLERAHRALSGGNTADRKDTTAKVLRHYLSLPHETKERVPLLDESSRPAIQEAFDRRQIPLGRWPADADVIPTLHQEFAVERLLDGKHPLVAVNGPPGTGKSVMVRELAAELVCRRAEAMARHLQPAAVFTGQSKTIEIGDRSYPFRVLREEVKGYELVICSNNNAAVENISLELPKRSALGDSYQAMSYLEPVAALYHALRRKKLRDDTAESDEESVVWGLPSVALGNKRNRNLFRRAAFDYHFDKEKEETEQRRLEKKYLTLYDVRSLSLSGKKSYAQARRDFLRSGQELREYLDHTSSSDGEHPLYNLSAPLHSYSCQLTAPFINADLNRLRSHHFACALSLHEAWVREAPGLDRELRALSKLLSNPQAIAPHEARDIWALLFLIVPIVSTTLASVERMFQPLPEDSLGYLVVDEAGQATPQSVVGALLRTKQALVIGDQRQLEPIVTIPKVLDQHCRRGLRDEQSRLVSPLHSSAQKLADQQMRYGMTLDSEFSGESVWVGIPLLVHRRCFEPMFRIANRIAYDDVMIYGTSGDNVALPLGDSCWVTVGGEATKKHWVAPQGEVCKRLLELMLRSDLDREYPDLFFITPFRVVKEQLQRVMRSYATEIGLSPDARREARQRIGTVHTFQGKEAHTVVLVLGCDRRSEAAAEWAGAKPNLVNVAVTRARNALYVIGDDDLWHNKGYFSDLEKSLPKRTVGEIVQESGARIQGGIRKEDL